MSEQTNTPSETTLPEKMRSTATFLMDCHGDLDHREAGAVADKLKQGADALESAEARAQALEEAADTLLLMLDNKAAWLLADDGPAITDAKDKLRALLKERAK